MEGFWGLTFELTCTLWRANFGLGFRDQNWTAAECQVERKVRHSCSVWGLVGALSAGCTKRAKVPVPAKPWEAQAKLEESVHFEERRGSR